MKNNYYNNLISMDIERASIAGVNLGASGYDGSNPEKAYIKHRENLNELAESQGIYGVFE